MSAKNGRKTMRLSGFLMPGTDGFDGGRFLKKVLLDGFEKEIQIIVPKDLISDEDNERKLHVEIISDNNFHTSHHRLVHEILVKQLKETPEQNMINFCKIKGEISFLHVYGSKVDVIVHARRGRGDKGRDAYIPISFFEEKSFKVGQYVRVYGHLVQRSYKKDGISKEVLEVIGDYVY